MTRILLAIAVVFAIGLYFGARLARAEDPYFVLASTTSVDNSGLLTHILPLFKKASGIDVRVVALGTGQALDTARRGDADLVLVHDPDAEQKFIDEGHGINRREIAWNGLRTNYVNRLSEFAIPTLILHGEEDRLLPVAIAERAHRLIRNSRLEIIPDCGHLALFLLPIC